MERLAPADRRRTATTEGQAGRGAVALFSSSYVDRPALGAAEDAVFRCDHNLAFGLAAMIPSWNGFDAMRNAGIPLNLFTPIWCGRKDPTNEPFRRVFRRRRYGLIVVEVGSSRITVGDRGAKYGSASVLQPHVDIGGR